jgi:hypothetical protein
MKKRLKKLRLSKETLLSLEIPEHRLEKAAGRCYGTAAGTSCLTDLCSVAYCPTAPCTGIRCV